MIRNYWELTRLEMESLDRENTVVLIPLGALEQHGNQAPLGTDFLIAGAMLEYLKKEIEKVDRDYPMLMFPPMPIGLSTEHKNFCGSITFKPETYYHMLYDIGAGLARHGFRKLAFLVCHGGNAPVVQILSRELRSADRIHESIEKLGYRTGYDESYEGHFQFAIGDEEIVPDGEPAYKVIPGYPFNNPWFEYQENEGVYHRFQYGDRHYGDEGQIAVKNIIFQLVMLAVIYNVH